MARTKQEIEDLCFTAGQLDAEDYQPPRSDFSGSQGLAYMEGYCIGQAKMLRCTISAIADLKRMPSLESH